MDINHPQKHIAVVLGMHRSGTSVITRGLQVLDVYLGDHLMSPMPENNETGFWEDLDINALNITLLEVLGHDWHTLAPIVPDELRTPAVTELKLRAIEMMQDKLSNTDWFGLKDPRMPRLLPFWQDVFVQLQAKVTYIIVCRNPMSVAHSLARRDGFDLEKGYYLWLEHMLYTLVLTGDQSRIVVDYDRLMEDPAGELSRMAQSLGVKFDPESPAFIEYRTQYLNESLRHDQFRMEDLNMDKTVPPGIIPLYKILVDLAGNNIQFDHPEVLSVIKNTSEQLHNNYFALSYMQSLDKKILEHARAIEELKRSVADRNRVITERDRMIAHQNNIIAERDSIIAERDAYINVIYNSYSWRLTRPLRVISRFMGNTRIFKKIIKSIGNQYSMAFLTRLSGFRVSLSKVIPPYLKSILHKVMDVTLGTRLIRLIAPKLSIFGDFDSIVRGRKTVLIVSHEGSRTGAPILTYNLAKNLLSKYNVVVLFLGPGPLLNACHAIGAIVLGPLKFRLSKLICHLAISQILNRVMIDFAIVNSIEARFVLPALKSYCVTTISLIHEFAANTRPRSAFHETVYWSDQTVFSTNVTRDNMLAEYPELNMQEYPVIPQGRCILPALSNYEEQMKSDDNFNIQQSIRPPGFPPEGIVVLGVGLVQIRKGVDLFIQCASAVRRKAPDVPVRFVWVGTGYNPDYDVAYSAYLSDQIQRAGLENHVCFIDEVLSLDTIYAEVDLLLLCSRLDPLPNVAIDALAHGLPVLCFDKTTGIADILSDSGLANLCVAEFLDVDDMACKLLAIAESKDLKEKIADQSMKIAAATFDMDKYIARIEQLAFKAIDQCKQSELDFETIVKSDLLTMDYYFPPNNQLQTRDEAIGCYLRSWTHGMGRRKLFPGFHPGIYLEQHGVKSAGVDPLADYLRAGQPNGPWNFKLIKSGDNKKPLPQGLRIGLHIHVYYLDLLPNIIQRLKQNHIRPDLLISVTNEFTHQGVDKQLNTYDGEYEIRIVPNRGRDIGPFLTEFGTLILQKYDLIGHVHTKKTLDIKDKITIRNWNTFLQENLLGGHAPMADIILGEMANNINVNLVFPDDPNIVGWGKNYGIAENLMPRMGINILHREICFPVGTMFWARPKGLKRLFDLNLDWKDYPEEPLPYDGTLLHALERLFGIVAMQNDGSIILTNVSGITR